MAGHEDLVTYLSLTPAFGGTRFGPFEGLEVRLGADPDRCHIVLPEALGVVKEHVRLIRQGPLNLILAPADRTATVFLYKQGERRPSQLYTPTAVRPGDAFALVTQDGPRFVIEADELPAEIKAQRDEARAVATGRRRLSADSMATETKRQIWTRLLVLGPAQIAQRAWLYIQSGAIYQPRNIFLAVTVASGWLFGGMMSCNGSKTRSALATTQTRVESCESELGFAEEMGEKEDLKIYDLATMITRSNLLGTTLKEDKELYKQVKKEARNLYANRGQYEWFYTASGNQARSFQSWAEKVQEREGIHPDTAKLLLWLGAHPGNRRHQDYGAIYDSQGEYSCALGPANLTYRQSVRLNLRAMPDAYHYGDIEEIASSNEKMEEKVTEVLTSSMMLDRLTEEAAYDVKSLPNNDEHCIHQDGTDARKDSNKILSQFARAIPDDSTLLPVSGTIHSPTAWLAMFYSMDLVRHDPTLSYQGSAVSSTVDNYDKGKEWILERTAEVIARSMVLPCLLRLEGDSQAVKAMLGDSAPQKFPCLYLNYELQNAAD